MPRAGPKINTIPQETKELFDLIDKAMSLARTLKDEKNPNLVDIATNSPDRVHKIAVCFYCGMELHVCECLFVLMQDSDPLVIHAAEISCEEIANKKYKEIEAPDHSHVNFGPFLLRKGDTLEKIRSEDPEQLALRCKSSADLWQAFFEKKEAELKSFRTKGKTAAGKQKKGT